MMQQDRYTGKQVGNYRIKEKIGQGGFGTVYTGSHISYARTVAIKLLNVQGPFADKQQQQFEQEAKLLAELEHDHILPILDYYPAPEGFPPCLITRYASNGSLASKLRALRLSNKWLSLDETCAILSQVGEALTYAHQKKVIHRDLKPDNILFNEKGQALLADFGIAVMLDAEGGVAEAGGTGTPRYMAPEQFSGNFSEKSDQYSLGVIAYELVTGYHPITVSTEYPLAWIAQHKIQQIQSPGELNPDLPLHMELAILKALAKKPEDRHADISAFIRTLTTAAYELAYYQKIKEQFLVEALAAFTTGAYADAVKLYERAIQLDRSAPVAYCGKGDAFVAMQRYNDALDAYGQAIRLDASSSDAYYGKGDALFRLKRYQESLAALERAIQLDGDHQKAHTLKGNILALLQRHAEALATYERTIRLAPHDSQAYSGKGAMLLALMDFAAARDSYQEAIKRSSDNVRNYLGLAEALTALGHYEDALAAYAEARRLLAGQSPGWQHEGNVFYMRGEYTGALEAYQKAPDTSFILAQKGNILCHFGKYDQALEAYNQAVNRTPHYIDALLGKGLCLERLQNYSEAAKTFQRVIELDAHIFAAWSHKGDAFFSLRAYDKALEAYEQALRLDMRGQGDREGRPYHILLELHVVVADVYHRMGMALASLQRNSEAVDAYVKAIELAPENARFYYDWGNALFASGYMAEARNAYAEALKRGFKVASLYQYKGQACYAQGLLEEALADFETAARLNPDEISNYMSKAKTLYDLERYQDALAILREVIQRDPRCAGAYYYLAEIYSKRGILDEALSAYNKANQLQTGNANTLTGRGRILYLLRRYEDALADLGAAIRINPGNAVANFYSGLSYETKSSPDYVKALLAFKQVTRYDPGYAVAWCAQGNVLFKLKKYEEAQSAYHEALALDEKLAEAYDGQGKLYKLHHTYEQALESYQKAIELDPQTARWHIDKGDVLVMLKKYQHALESYEEAINLDSNNAEIYKKKSRVLTELGRYEEARQADKRAAQLENGW